MESRPNRRSALTYMGAVGAGLVSSAPLFGAARADGINYSFINKTNGKFADDQCFWSLNGGRDWHSFAKEPTVPCPKGNGRVYFRLGAAPKNLDDRQAYWDFIEYACDGTTWHG